jgi:acetyl esterase/lipase
MPAASALPRLAVVISLHYSLAPEHSIPTPRRMAPKAMSWLRAATTTDPWLPNAADVARLFVRWQHRPPRRRQFWQDRPRPTVRLRGHVLLVWTMAGEAQTRAELECTLDTYLSTETSTTITRCPALMLEVVEMAPVLVVTAERSVLRDRNAEYARRMKGEWPNGARTWNSPGWSTGSLAGTYGQSTPMSSSGWSSGSSRLLEHMDSEYHSNKGRHSC